MIVIVIKAAHFAGKTFWFNIILIELIEEVALKVIHTATFEAAITFVLSLLFRITGNNFVEVIASLTWSQMTHFGTVSYSMGFEELFPGDVIADDMVVGNIAYFFAVKVV